jgi:hypothetical protein
MKSTVLKFCWVASILVACHAGTAAAAGPQVKPTLAAAKADFDAAEYPACLGKISTLISSTRSDSVERYDLLMLRGECMLRLKNRAPALTAFDAASAVGRRQNDVKRVAASTALSQLVKASPNLVYRSPKAASDEGGGIDIIEPASRQKAMGVLLADLSEKIAPQFNKVLSEEKSLASTDAMLKGMWELYSVELAATGDTVATSEKLEALGAHAQKLIAAELDTIKTRLDQLEDLAGEPVGGYHEATYRGLRTDERNELKQQSDYLMKVQRTVENARRIARLLGRTGERWDALLADCAVARDSAQRAYDRRN